MIKQEKKAFVLLFEGYADWETGHVLAELRRLGNVEVTTVGFTKEPQTSMGGLCVTPAKTLAEINTDEMLIFIIPGGHMWEGRYPHEDMLDLLNRLGEAKVPIAGICAATTVLARAGLLNDRKHTSNSITYLSEKAPDYTGHALYEDTLATRDNGVITASGLGAVDFAMEVLCELDLSTPDMRAIWYDAFKHGIYPDHVAHGG